MSADFTRLLAVSAVVMGISYTISRERIFQPLRDRLGGKQTWFGYLVSCPYCLSHYLAFMLVPLTGAYGLHVSHDWGLVSRLLDWFLSSILVTVIAAFLRIAFFFIDETQGLIRRRQKVTEEEVQKERLERKRLEIETNHIAERDEGAVH